MWIKRAADLKDASALTSLRPSRKQAADLKDVRSLTACGYAYLGGRGVERSISRGFTMLGCQLGSCAGVGGGVRHSRQGERRGALWVRQEPQEATRLYREMEKCNWLRERREHPENLETSCFFAHLRGGSRFVARCMLRRESTSATVLFLWF